MPVRFLLDEHISPKVARLLRERAIDAVALREWHNGQYLSRPDDEILRAAHQLEGRALVTFDVHSIPTVIRYFAESGTDHSGVIFVSTEAIGQDDVARLSAALERLAALQGDQPLENQVLFLSVGD